MSLQEGTFTLKGKRYSLRPLLKKLPEGYKTLSTPYETVTIQNKQYLVAEEKKQILKESILLS